MKKEEEEEEEEEEKKKKKRKRKEWSEIRFAIEELSLVKPKQGQDDGYQVSTLAFLAASNLLLHFLDKIGPTMAVLRQDIQRNIERLKDVYVSEPSNCSSLVEILKKEASEGASRKAGSCSRAILWLTRSMDFSMDLLERVNKEECDLSLRQMVEEAYKATLKPWHGWISSAAYKVALKLIPERETFTSLLMGKEQDHCILKSDVQSLISVIQPLLTHVHAALKKIRLDRLKST